MTKVVSFSLVILFLFAFSLPLFAQQDPADEAVNQAIINQANTIVLRQKLVEARAAIEHGDLNGAAKLYEDAYALTQKIGSGIDNEMAQTINGLVSVHLELASRAQKNGDYLEADAQITRAWKVAPQDPNVQEFKRNNDAILVSMKGKMPDTATVQKIPEVTAQKQDAGTLVQDGKLLYEMGKFEEAEVKLSQALKLDPDNQAAFYYLNLVKQNFYEREEHKRITGQQEAMLQVQKEWTPKTSVNLPTPNPYVTNMDVHTGIGRELIYNKLARIRLDSVSWGDGLPLAEVIRHLSDQAKLRDPDKHGINFLFNPNPEISSAVGAAPGGIGPGAPQAVDPTTGLPRAGGGPTGTESVDPGSITVQLVLSEVTLQEALDAIVMVAHPHIRYSVTDFGVVFSQKPDGPEPPQLDTRVFKTDPNTFYQGLQSVTSFNFGSANNNSSGGGGGNSGGGGGGGGNSGGGGGGNSGSGVSGAVVPIVDVTGGGRGRNGGNGGGGGGGANGAAGGGGNGGGIQYLTSVGQMQDVSVAARTFFQAIGVDLTQPGRSIAFNDRLGLLFVKATASELDTIERTIQALNQVAPQVHVKARFIEVSQDDSTSLGFDWYLGNFINGKVIANGGSAPSLNVPASVANPAIPGNGGLGAFPGNSLGNIIPTSPNDQLLTGGLRNSGPALATITGILTDPNFRVVLHALQQRSGVETLAEPEVVTTSGRQTQMRATDIQYILTGFNFQQSVGGGAGTGTP